MLLTCPVRAEKRSEIPAVTHIDGSARVQTVNAEQHPEFHALLSAFERRTGCPVIINTSFNVRGEPIVESPKDALTCFLHTDMDYLILGNCLLRKAQIPKDRLKGREHYLKIFLQQD
jgi:carbamoyltransferase